MTRKRQLEENRRKRTELKTKVSKMPFAIRYTSSGRHVFFNFRRTRTYGEQ